MFASHPLDPSLNTIRWVLPPGPHEAWPRVSSRTARAGQRGHLQAVVAVVLAAMAAFGVGFVVGTADDVPPGSPGTGPMPGEFRLGPGNLPPPGIVVPLH